MTQQEAYQRLREIESYIEGFWESKDRPCTVRKSAETDCYRTAIDTLREIILR